MIGAEAIVLAGGRSSRFGGNKALALLRGEPIVTRLCRQLLQQFSQVALVTKTPALYEAVVPLSVARIADISPEANPLVGLATGLSWTPAEVVFAVACDMPFAVAPAVVSRLRAALEGQPAAAFTWQGLPEPLCAFYRRSACLPVVRDLAAAGRGPRHVLVEVQARMIAYEEAFPEDKAGLPFLDLDTPEDLTRAEAFLT